MDLGLTGKSVIVAASSKGLGRAVARQFLLEGALVTINGRDADELAKTAAALRDETGGDVLEIPADMSKPADVQRLIDATIEARGGLDALVCNAGGPPPGRYADFPDDEPWQAAINLNLMSTNRLIRHALPHLNARGGGSVTTIMSTSVKQPIPHLILSNTARSAVIGLVKSLSLEYAAQNIRFNNVLPGTTRTGRVTTLAENRAKSSGQSVEEILADDAKAIPMGRLGEPHEFANAVVFLASPAASYITGVSLQVDGGTIRSI